MPVTDIEPADVLAAIRKIEIAGNLESARRTLQLASAVFRYAVATARLLSDPTRDLKGVLSAPKVTHYGAITDASRVGGLLRAIGGYEGQGMTRLALLLAPHVFVRPGELRHARWDEIDLETGLWTIPASKMKMRKVHRRRREMFGSPAIEQIADNEKRALGIHLVVDRRHSRGRKQKAWPDGNTFHGALAERIDQRTRAPGAVFVLRIPGQDDEAREEIRRRQAA